MRTRILFIPAAQCGRHAARGASFILLWVLCTIAWPAPVAAQSSSISGVVKDPQQAVVPGAEVTLRNARSAATPSVVTDASGSYSFT
jgi:hypothetical protein